MIKKVHMAGKRVITATEMLETMTHSPRPTRAEVSDVANAVYDKTTCIMLSGESAAGKYPVESVTAMKEIAEYAEENINYEKRFKEYKVDLGDNFLAATCYSAVNAAYQFNAKAIICVTNNGLTAFNLSSYHPVCPIIAITVNEKACRQLNLCWNVHPIYAEKKDSIDELFTYAIETALKTNIVQKGDRVIITGASAVGNAVTDTIKLHIL
jgi:pyruvate kinase